MNPRTMLCVLISVEELASDPARFDSGEPSVLTVEAEDSSKVACEDEGCGVESSSSLFCGCEMVGICMGECSGECSGEVKVLPFSAGLEGVDAVGRGMSSGSSSFFSLIEITIFSRSIGVMCFSQPLLLLSIESCLLR